MPESPDYAMLFADESLNKFSPPRACITNACSAVQSILPICSPERLPMKSPLRRLNLDREAQVHSSNIVVEINKISGKELTRFIGSPERKQIKLEDGQNCGEKIGKEENKDFYQLRSSPMQMFNSFSPNASYLSQTIGHKMGKEPINSERKSLNKRMCCNCKRSRCLKLYCECFLNKTFCFGCNCANCLNIEGNREQRDKAMQATLDRNPIAFDPKFARDTNDVIFKYR